MNIGVFDSGLGGLTILTEFLKLLPDYNYIYLGDNGRVPYGGRSKEVIYEYTRQAVEFLFNKKAVLVILACNTATAAALKKLQREYLPLYYPDRRILGIIKPVVEEIALMPAKKIGVIGTRATMESHSFKKEIAKVSPTAQVFEISCPLLVPIIEEGEGSWEGVDLLLHKYLTPLKKQQIDTLILGCTHYRLIDRKIKHVIGNNVKVLSEGRIAARKLKEYVYKHPEINSRLAKNFLRHYFVTDINDLFTRQAQLFLGEHFTAKDQLELIHL